MTKFGQPKEQRMNAVLWTIQGILAGIFAMAGFLKSTQSKDKLLKRLPWVNHFPLLTVRFIGISELIGAIGIIVPMVTGIMPILSPIAAIGLAAIMIMAAFYHIHKREYREVLFNVTLFIPLAVIVFYRF
jgi:uncharacterized membrane protein YphA (DoxX/SURF4 family)